MPSCVKHEANAAAELLDFMPRNNHRRYGYLVISDLPAGLTLGCPWSLHVMNEISWSLHVMNKSSQSVLHCYNGFSLCTSMQVNDGYIPSLSAM